MQQSHSMERILENSDLMMIDNMSNAVEMGQARDMTSRLGDSLNLLVPFTDRQLEEEGQEGQFDVDQGKIVDQNLLRHFAGASLGD